jgi:hypothetical protein
VAAADQIASARRNPMLALNLFGTKEIVVYVVIIVIVVIAIIWYSMRGRRRI